MDIELRLIIQGNRFRAFSVRMTMANKPTPTIDSPETMEKVAGKMKKDPKKANSSIPAHDCCNTIAEKRWANRHLSSDFIDEAIR